MNQFYRINSFVTFLFLIQEKIDKRTREIQELFNFTIYFSIFQCTVVFPWKSLKQLLMTIFLKKGVVVVVLCLLVLTCPIPILARQDWLTLARINICGLCRRLQNRMLKLVNLRPLCPKSKYLSLVKTFHRHTVSRNLKKSSILKYLHLYIYCLEFLFFGPYNSNFTKKIKIS